MKQSIADGEACSAGQYDQTPVARGGVCGGMLDHIRAQIGLDGIPQPVFLQLIAADNGLNEA